MRLQHLPLLQLFPREYISPLAGKQEHSALTRNPLQLVTRKEKSLKSILS